MSNSRHELFLTVSRRKFSGHIRSEAARRRRLISITHWNNDEWNGFADLLANLIEKYAAVLDIDNLPEPSSCFVTEKNEIANASAESANTIEKAKIRMI